jgi:hypothetical protein
MTHWKAEGRKVKNATLRAINTRMKKRVGESDLGRMMKGDSPVMHGHKTEPQAGPHENQARLYAQALGVSLEDAQARIARHEAILKEAGQLGAGTNPKQAAEWVDAQHML